MWYHEHVRREIQPLLPNEASQILDIGAGAGSTLKWLKSVYPNAKTTGVEINPALHAQLAENADAAIIGDVDRCLSQLRSYDLILLLDVLEHVVDPAGTLKKLSTRLSLGGSVIVSVPNVAHVSISVPLLLQRRFHYRDSGILDRTHLRFFVEETAIDLLNSANLCVTKGVITGLTGVRARWADRLSLGLLRHHLAKQYVMVGELRDKQIVKQKVHWILE